MMITQTISIFHGFYSSQSIWKRSFQRLIFQKTIPFVYAIIVLYCCIQWWRLYVDISNLAFVVFGCLLFIANYFESESTENDTETASPMLLHIWMIFSLPFIDLSLEPIKHSLIESSEWKKQKNWNFDAVKINDSDIKNKCSCSTIIQFEIRQWS